VPRRGGRAARLSRVDVLISAAGALTATVGASGACVASGTAAAVARQAGRHGITPVDLLVVLIVMVMAAVGAVVNEARPELRSWVVAGPAIGLGATYLVGSVVAQRAASGRLLFGLVGGVVLVGIGGIRRLAAPLVLGTATLLALLAIAAWSALGSTSVWAWLGIGGSALLTLAVISEHGDRDTPATRRLVELVWERYG
jgi:hypothetical protein